MWGVREKTGEDSWERRRLGWIVAGWGEEGWANSGGKGKAGADIFNCLILTLVDFLGYKICNKSDFKVRRNKFKMAASIKELD